MIPILRRVSSKCNSLLADISMKTGLNLNKPAYICVKMTMLCNSRCLHCNIWDMDFNEQELSTEQWKHSISSLGSWLGHFTLAFTGGEALLRPDMLEIIRHAKQLGITVRLNSNAIIITETLAKQIVESGLDQITISLDGILPSTHDSFRGGEQFHEKTFMALEYLSKATKLQKSRMAIQIKTVIHNGNIEQLSDIARFALAKSFEILYQPIEQNYGELPDPKWYKNSKLWVKDLCRLKSEIEILKGLRHSNPDILNTEEDFDTILTYFEQPEKLMDAVQGHDTKTSSEYCRHAVTNFVISSNGDVRMCYKMDPIGNISSQEPEKIWNNRPRCWNNKCKFNDEIR